MAHNGIPAAPHISPAKRGLGDRLLDRLFTGGTILETERIAARTIRIRIGGAELHEMKWIPGQQIRVITGDTATGNPLSRLGELRTYSVWHHDPEAGELHLCVLDHGDGPGARWARTAEVGQPVRFRGPEGTFTLTDDASYHLFAGEDTAAAAFGPMLRSLP
ncbi:siderophore-interacting protein, partial [Nocardia alni]|uniref:siderophore-interacting protein n=1 Tax=Nocardia alni TaxID=2815723 RepID=UPI001C21EBB0